MTDSANPHGEAFCDACETLGLEPPRRITITTGSRGSPPVTNPAEILEACRGLDALCCIGRRPLRLMSQVCLQAGVRVPAELQLACTDADILSSVCSAVAMDRHFDRVGRRAVEIVLDAAEGRISSPVQEVISSSLVLPRLAVSRQPEEPQTAGRNHETGRNHA
jgi:DNA-binding LacI/PurR family transcriptional regulator